MAKKADKEKKCVGCGGKCCSYAAINIDAPRSLEDWEGMVFYIYHGAKVSVSEEKGKRDWLLEFKGRCKHLTAGGRCRTYEHRPKVCRDHSAEDCERHGAGKLVEMETAQELLKYMKKVRREKWVKRLEQQLPESERRKKKHS